MTDQELAGLFAEGTAPERDPEFALQVEAEIGRARLRIRLLELAFRAVVTLLLASAALVAVRAIKPVVGQLVAGSPEFMGVPVPIVLIAVVTGLALHGRRYIGMVVARVGGN